MNKIYKIFLSLALFLALTGIAWAGFNYESDKNYFLIDSFLNASGNYILVGNALNALPADVNALAVSNNLIFLKDSSQFTDYYARKIAKNAQGYYFSTPNITIHSDSDFRIAAPGRAGFLSFISNNLKVDQDLYIKNGLNIATDLTTLAPKTIAVSKVLAATLSHLTVTDPPSPLDSPAQAVLYFPILAGSTTSTTTAKAGFPTDKPIKFGVAGKDLCVTYTWDAKAQVENGGKTNIWKADNLVDGTLINKICPDKYFVFDLNASPDPISGLGKLVCCQYTITPAITPPDTILNINSF